MKRYDKDTDEELIALTQKGNQLAEEHLLDKYKAVVRKKVRAMYLIEIGRAHV